MIVFWGQFLFQWAFAMHPTCETHLNCPPALAQLQGNNSVCTAFLIDNDLVATNLHCLPPHLQRAGSDCSQIDVVFLKNPQGEQIKRKCNYVEKASAKMEAVLSPDTALLRLNQPVNINPLRLAPASGLKHKEYATIFKINPTTSAEIPPQVEKVECQAVQKSMLNPYFDNPQSAVFAFYPCKVIPGNSGSPVLNENNEVVAVINSRSTLNIKDNIPYLAHLSGEAAFATHIRCLRTPDSCRGTFNDEEAAKKYKEIESVIFKRLEEQLKKEAISTENELYQKSGKLIRWSLKDKTTTPTEKADGLIAKYSFIPYCFNIDPKSIEKNRTKLSKNQFTKSYPVYDLNIYLKFNEQLNLTSDIKKNEGTIELSMIPADLTKAQLQVTLTSLDKSKPKNLTLSLCQ
ncbi:MAG: trypsin-like serine peptidase [Bdellovibrionia bacterium]